MDLSLFPELNALTVFTFVLGGILSFVGVRRIIKRKFVTGSVTWLMGSCFIAASVSFVLLISNLYTYQRLTNEEFVINLKFNQTGKMRYQVELIEETGKSYFLELKGDEWQIDARIIKWNGFATLLGLDTFFRLERLSGRYRDITQERSSVRNVYALSDDNGLDIWHFSKEYKNWLPWIDSVYGSATYLPMSDGASYLVTMSNSGLVARPVNEIAKKSVKNWK